MDIRTYQIERLPLLSAVNRVCAAVGGTAGVQPILSHLRINITMAGKVLITAGDLDTFADTECDAIVAGAGAGFCVPAVKLKGAVGSIPSEHIGLAWRDGKNVSINGDGIVYSFDTLQFEDYPQPISVAPSETYVFHPKQLTRLIKAVSHASSTDPHKYNLGGINLGYEADRKQFTVCATDGHRVSVAGVMTVDDIETFPKSVVLPNKPAKIVSDIAGTIELTIDKNNISIATPGLDLTARLIDGDFPDWRRVVPKDHDLMVTVNRPQLIDALAAVGVVEDKSKTVTIAIESEQMELRALGQNSLCTAMLPYTGDDQLRISVNSKYLMAALKALDGDEIFFKYKADGCNSLLIYPGDCGSFDERFEMIMAIREN